MATITTFNGTHAGTITSVNLDRGFGFICKTGETKTYFFHVSQLRGIEFDERISMMRVQFELQTHSDGRVRAVNIRPAR